MHFSHFYGSHFSWKEVNDHKLLLKACYGADLSSAPIKIAFDIWIFQIFYSIHRHCKNGQSQDVTITELTSYMEYISLMIIMEVIMNSEKLIALIKATMKAADESSKEA